MSVMSYHNLRLALMLFSMLFGNNVVPCCSLAYASRLVVVLLPSSVPNDLA